MDTTGLKKNIRSIYERKELALYALALNFAAMAINYFRQLQPSTPGAQGAYWHNRTGQAAARVFSNAELTRQFISWFMAHGVQYGDYLELANNRRHEALKPIIERYVGRYLQDAQRIFKD
jgi:hypothetical protein